MWGHRINGTNRDFAGTLGGEHAPPRTLQGQGRTTNPNDAAPRVIRDRTCVGEETRVPKENAFAETHPAETNLLGKPRMVEVDRSQPRPIWRLRSFAGWMAQRSELARRESGRPAVEQWGGEDGARRAARACPP